MTVHGPWRLLVDSPLGTQDVTIDFVTENNRVSGTVYNNGNGMRSDVFDGVANGADLTFKVKIQKPRITLTFQVTVVDDELSGTVKAGMFGRFNVSGKPEVSA